MDGQLRTGLTAFACTDLLHGGATVSLVGIVGTSMRQDAEDGTRTQTLIKCMRSGLLVTGKQCNETHEKLDAAG